MDLYERENDRADIDRLIPPFEPVSADRLNRRGWDEERISSDEIDWI